MTLPVVVLGLVVQISLAVWALRTTQDLVSESRAGIRPSNAIRGLRLAVAGVLVSLVALSLGFRDDEWSVPIFIIVLNLVWTALWFWKLR